MGSKERLCIVCGTWIPESQPIAWELPNEEFHIPMHVDCAEKTAEDGPYEIEYPDGP